MAPGRRFLPDTEEFEERRQLAPIARAALSAPTGQALRPMRNGCWGYGNESHSPLVEDIALGRGLRREHLTDIVEAIDALVVEGLVDYDSLRARLRPHVVEDSVLMRTLREQARTEPRDDRLLADWVRVDVTRAVPNRTWHAALRALDARLDPERRLALRETALQSIALPSDTFPTVAAHVTATTRAS